MTPEVEAPEQPVAALDGGADRADASPRARPLVAADWRLLALLLLAAALTRLIGLDHPDSVVFDEVYFGRFATSYCCDDARIFDIHPPHGKLLAGGVAKLLGYEGGIAFAKIGEPFAGISPVPLRLLPALLGSVIPVLVALLVLQLGGSRPAALLAGGAVVVDGAFVAQSRLVNLDTLLIAATLATLILFIHGVARGGGRGWLFAAAAGVAAGLAVGSKFTGLLAFALPPFYLVGSRLLEGRLRGDLLRPLGYCLLLWAVAVAVYLAGWYLHFQLLTAPGPGDVWGGTSGNFFADTLHLHRQILSYNVATAATHGDGSHWWAWPLMLAPIYYWAGKGAEAGSHIYLLGNPLLWWGVAALLTTLLVNLALARVSSLRVRASGAGGVPRPLWLPLGCYAMAYLPFLAIGRVMFLYHYFPPLLFSIVALALWLDEIGWIRGEAGRRQRASLYMVVALVLATALWLAPLAYGSLVGAQWAMVLFTLFPGWR